MVDWSRLQTAVGDATNAPLHLEALLGPEPQRRAAAVRFLDEALYASAVSSAVPHQTPTAGHGVAAIDRRADS